MAHLLEVLEQVGIDKAVSTLVEWAVDGDNITLRDHLLEIRDVARTNLLLRIGRESGEVVIQVLLGVKRHEPFEHAVANTTCTDHADGLALEVKGSTCDVGDLPVAALDHFMGRHEVVNEEQDAHDDVLCDRGHI